LSITAVASLALTLFFDLSSTPTEERLSVDWAEGIAIVVAILIIVTFDSLNNWQKERKFRALNEKKESHLVKVIRDGIEQQIHTHQVVVGDVMLLEPGDVIPCDGVFLSGHNVRLLCDESCAAGESDAIKKLSYQECTAPRDRRVMELDADGSSGDSESPPALELFRHTDCFIVSGSKVLDGTVSYVITSVGTKSPNDGIMMGSFNALPRVYAL
jgi:Ca2+-transporting ATPase